MKNLFLYLLIFNIFRQCVPLCAQSSNISEEAQKFYKQACQYYDSGFFENAIEYYKKSLVINPDFSFAYTFLGHAYYNLNAIEKAIESYKRTIDINEKTGEYGNLGWCLILQGEFTQATQACKKAVKYNPLVATHRFNLAHTYLLRGDTKKEFYRKALSLLESKEQFMAITEDFLLFIKNDWQVEACRKVMEWMQHEIENIDHFYRDADSWFGEAVTLGSQGEYLKAVQMFEKAIDLEKKSFEPRPVYLSSMLGWTAYCYLQLKEYEKAVIYAKEALEIINKNELQTDNAALLNTIAISYNALGKFQKAIRYFEEVLEIDEKLNRQAQCAITLSNIGEIYRLREQFDNAIKYFEKALQINEKLNNESDISMNLRSIGYSYKDKVQSSKFNEQYEKALDYFQRSLAIERNSGSELIASLLNNIGELYSALGKYNKALKKYEEALTLSKDQKKENLTAAILNNTGEIYLKLYQYNNALNYFERALLINQGLDEQTAATATNLNNIGEVYRALDQYRNAIKYLQKSNKLVENLQQQDMVAVLFNNIGETFTVWGKFDSALYYFEKALIINKQLGINDAVALCLSNIGTVYYTRGKYDKANKYFEKALAICKKFDVKDQLANLYNNIGLVKSEWGKYDEAIQYYENGLQIAKKQGQENQFVKTLHDEGEVSRPRLHNEEVSRPRLHHATSLQIAVFLNNLGLVYSEKGEYDKALHFYERSLTIEKKLGNEGGVAVAFINIGSVYKEWRKNDSAIYYFQKALVIDKKLGRENKIAIDLTNIGNFYLTTNQYNKAYEYFLEAMTIFESLDQQDKIATLFNEFGEIYRAWGQYDKALNYFKRSLVIDKKLGKQPALASLFNNMGLVYWGLGDYEKALQHYEKALGIAKEFTQQGLIAIIYSSMGLAHNDLGKYDMALNYFEMALKIDKKLNKERSIAIRLNNIGLVYSAFGQYENAIINYKEALNIAEKLDLQTDKATYYSNIGLTYYQWGQYQPALDNFEKAYAIAMESGKRNNIAIHLNNIGLVYDLFGEYDQAIISYKNAISIERESGKVYDDPLFLNNIAEAYKSLGSTDSAMKYYQKALDFQSKTHPFYTTTLINMATFYMELGQNHKAEPLFLQANKNLLDQIVFYFPSLSEKEKEKFYQTINYSFELFNSFALQRSKSNPEILCEMYNNQLATKALLLNAVTKMKNRIINSQDDSLIALYYKWIIIKERLTKAYSLPSSQASGDILARGPEKDTGELLPNTRDHGVKIQRQEINLNDLEKLANNIEKKLSLRSEIFASVTDKKNYTWKDVRKKLKKDEAAVEIIRIQKYDKIWTDNVCYAALIVKSTTKKHPELVVLENGNELEKKYLSYYRNSIKFKISDKISYRQYWYKIAQKLSQSAITKVWFSPDGVYNLINLNTLQIPDNGKYLLENTDIHIVTNTKDIIAGSEVSKPRLQKETHTLQSPNHENLSVFFGYPNYELGTQERIDIISQKQYNTPQQFYVLNIERGENLQMLPGTRQEVEEISNILAREGWKQQVFLEDQALEENLKAVKNPKVLHIATHGFFNKDSDIETQDNPLLNSGLMLAGASTTLNNSGSSSIRNLEDGILTAYEAMNLNLDKTDLVVLSACETALGEVRNGEGVYGLQRAFIIAGARAIIMSLWKVNDVTTRELMITFYKNWISSGNKQDAFKKAQLSLKEKYEFPYYWGAFVMVGE